jgi:hypothetical protein
MISGHCFKCRENQQTAVELTLPMSADRLGASALCGPTSVNFSGVCPKGMPLAQLRKSDIVMLAILSPTFCNPLYENLQPLPDGTIYNFCSTAVE